MGIINMALSIPHVTTANWKKWNCCDPKTLQLWFEIWPTARLIAHCWVGLASISSWAWREMIDGGTPRPALFPLSSTAIILFSSLGIFMKMMWMILSSLILMRGWAWGIPLVMPWEYLQVVTQAQGKINKTLMMLLMLDDDIVTQAHYEYAACDVDDDYLCWVCASQSWPRWWTIHKSWWKIYKQNARAWGWGDKKFTNCKFCNTF